MACDNEHVASSEGLQQSRHLALSIAETENLPLQFQTAGNTTPTPGYGIPGAGAAAARATCVWLLTQAPKKEAANKKVPVQRVRVQVAVRPRSPGSSRRHCGRCWAGPIVSTVTNPRPLWGHSSEKLLPPERHLSSRKAGPAAVTGLSRRGHRPTTCKVLLTTELPPATCFQTPVQLTVCRPPHNTHTLRLPLPSPCSPRR